LLFVIDPDHLWKRGWIEGEPGASALDGFIKLIGGKHVYNKFTTPDNLQALVSPALSKVKDEIESSGKDRHDPKTEGNGTPSGAFDPDFPWGTDPEPDFGTPSKPLTDAIRDQLIGLLPPQAGSLVGKPERISAGLSSASIFALMIKVDKLQTRSVFAKIDHYPRIVRESKIHAAVTRSAIRPFVPALVSDPLGPVDGWGIVFYQTAADTRRFAQSLDGVMTSDNGTLPQKTAPLKAFLNTALDKWHSGITRVIALDEDDLQNWIPVLAEGMLNLGGKNRMGAALRDRARDHGIGAEGSPVLRFTDCDLLLPNPIAYLLNETYWYDEKGHPIRIDAPRSPVHGDLHGGNLICVLDSVNKLCPSGL
jgi:hypothetical protein